MSNFSVFRRNKLLSRSFYGICYKTFASLPLLPSFKIGIGLKGSVDCTRIFRESRTRDSKTLLEKYNLRKRERGRRKDKTRRLNSDWKTLDIEGRRIARISKWIPKWPGDKQMRGWRHVPPLQPCQACTLSSPANLRANLKSISPTCPETLGTYVSTNYSVREVINVPLNYRRVFSDWRKSIKHAWGWRCPSSRIINPRLPVEITTVSFSRFVRK